LQCLVIGLTVFVFEVTPVADNVAVQGIEDVIGVELFQSVRGDDHLAEREFNL